MLEQKKSKQEILRATGATVGVNNISLSIEEGEIFVIMGLSGSGKSTLVRMFNRLIEPTKGNILIDGENLSVMDKKALRQVRREKMSMVFQNFGLFPHRTILETPSTDWKCKASQKRSARKERNVPWKIPDWETTAISIRTNYQVGCSSGSAWPVPWRMIRKSC